MAHTELVKSGLADMYNISHMTADASLAPFLGKVVRYKREVLTKEFIRAHGTVAKDCTFHIKEVQKVFDGSPALRGYIVEWADTFGRAIRPEHVEIV